MPNQRPAFVVPVLEEVKEVNTPAIVRMATRTRDLRAQKDELEVQLKTINAELERLSTELAEVMESGGVSGFKVPNVGTVYIKASHHPRVTNEPELLAWLDANGHGAIAKRSVHPSTLVGFVKEMLERAEGIPPGVSDFVVKKAVVKRS